MLISILEKSIIQHFRTSLRKVIIYKMFIKVNVEDNDVRTMDAVAPPMRTSLILQKKNKNKIMT